MTDVKLTKSQRDLLQALRTYCDRAGKVQIKPEPYGRYRVHGGTLRFNGASARALVAACLLKTDNWGRWLHFRNDGDYAILTAQGLNDAS